MKNTAYQICLAGVLLLTSACTSHAAPGDATKPSVPLVPQVQAPVLKQAPPATVLGGAVHIDSVTAEDAGGACRINVRITNRLASIAHSGSVFLDSNQVGRPHAEFYNLNPGQTLARTLLTGSRIPLAAQTQTFVVGIVMEPDNAAKGEIWDGIWHRLTVETREGRIVRSQDTTFTR